MYGVQKVVGLLVKPDGVDGVQKVFLKDGLGNAHVFMSQIPVSLVLKPSAAPRC